MACMTASKEFGPEAVTNCGLRGDVSWDVSCCDGLVVAPLLCLEDVSEVDVSEVDVDVVFLLSRIACEGT